jgi:serine/threonine protein phosphatase PrpC
VPESAFFAFGSASRRGPGRDENQDSSGVFPRAEGGKPRHPHERLFVVADGMGGHRGGREASQMVVHLVEEHFFSERADRPLESLRSALELANGRIFERSRAEAELQGMGSTCVALLLRGRSSFVAHVGDSRVYRIRKGSVQQLTTDHSRVQELVREDAITPEEAAQHEERHLLTRAVGVRPEVEVDLLGPLPLAEDDRFVLCSDGVMAIADSELAEITTNQPPQRACDALIQLTTERGGRDDATVQVVHVRRLPGALALLWHGFLGRAPTLLPIPSRSSG